MQVVRSLLFVPGNQPRMLDKALGLYPDAVVPDLEDSVPDGEKDGARRTVSEYLPRLAGRGPLVIPRVNALRSGHFEADLEAVVGPHTVGVSVGKVGTVQDVQNISAAMVSLERKSGIEPGATRLVLWLESALAIVNAYAICAASPRILGVAFGAEDFTNDMEIQRQPDDSEVVHARSVVAIAARAAGVLAVDTPYFAFRDVDGLRSNIRSVRKLGYKAKFAIHPAQVDIINEEMSPSATELERARRIVAAFEEAERAGRGSTSLDGLVIDVPVVKRARKLIETAEAISSRARAGA